MDNDSRDLEPGNGGPPEEIDAGDVMPLDRVPSAPRPLPVPGWSAGATALVEISPGPTRKDRYRVKYTPPLRPPIRRDWMDVPLTERILREIEERLVDVSGKLDRGIRSPHTGARTTPQTGSMIEELKSLGQMMYIHVLTRAIRNQLACDGLFLEFGVDESLLKFPWELIYDGRQFLCLRHFVGRFVNSSPQRVVNEDHEGPDPMKELLSVLLISVPEPQPRERRGAHRNFTSPGDEPSSLIEASKETEAIERILHQCGVTEDNETLKILRGPKATEDAVREELTRHDKRYHIIHYCGHAAFDRSASNESRIMLYDDITSDHLEGFLSQNRPVFCFINACESAKLPEASKRFNIYGLAQAFLMSGAYLVGNRYRVDDRAAAAFAGEFYRSLLLKRKSLGESMLHARLKCQEARPNRLDWTQFVLYGDPRFDFSAFFGPKGRSTFPTPLGV